MKYLKKLLSLGLAFQLFVSSTVGVNATDFYSDDFYSDDFYSDDFYYEILGENADTDDIAEEMEEDAEGLFAASYNFSMLSDEDVFTVYYHIDDDAPASEINTKVIYGVSTSTLTPEALNFEKPGKAFKGWKVYRSDNESWRVINEEATQSWKKELETGDDYFLFTSGYGVARTAPIGSELHLYAQWIDNTFEINYYAAVNEKYPIDTDIVEKGSGQLLRSAADLGLVDGEKAFKGWAVYRRDLAKWRVVNASGVASWASEVPAGGDYFLYGDMTNLSNTGLAGSALDIYALWEDNFFTVKYYDSLEADASPITTNIPYGTDTPIRKADTLDFEVPEGKVFKGWVAYREDLGKWRTVAANGSVSWTTEFPEDIIYSLLGDGAIFSKNAPRGSVLRLYAQWEDNFFTVKYYDQLEGEPSAISTTVPYGVNTEISSVEDLGFEIPEGKAFKGWAAYREDLGKWRNVDENGVVTWSSDFPEDLTYSLFADRASFSKNAPKGTVLRLYAQWEDNFFTVKYFESEEAPASSPIETKVVYGVGQKTESVAELGFSSPGKYFTGWKAYCPETNSWRVKNAAGVEMWSQTLPAGGEYMLYGNETILSKTVKRGQTLFFYAQWQDNNFTLKYHFDDATDASAMTTLVPFGKDTKSYTTEELGYSKAGMLFGGWYVKREKDSKWRVTDGENYFWSDVLDDNTICVPYADGAIFSNLSSAGNVLHLYAQWTPTNINVTDARYGATGNDTSDDSLAIQKALNMARSAKEKITIYVPAGTYYISKLLRIYSNTDLILDQNATIVRTDDENAMLITATAAEEKAGGYNQVSNIKISGGTWDGNITSFDARGYGLYSANLFYLFHANNIEISNTVMKHCCGNHFIEVAAVSDCLIDNVTFSDFVRYTGTDYSLIDNSGSTGGDGSGDSGAGNIAAINSEAIQLDYAGAANSEGAVPSDNTPCKNITVADCTFINCLAGIGNHHSEISMSGISITGNTFNHIDANCINLPNMNHVIVSNNIANNAKGFLSVIEGSNVQAYGNTASNVGFSGVFSAVNINNSIAELMNNKIVSTSGLPVNVNNSSVSFQENTIDTTSNDTDWNSLYVKDSSADVQKNTFIAPRSNGIVFDGTSGGQIAGNVITDATSAGIYYRASERADILDNHIDGTGTAGILFNSSVVKNTISNNEINHVGTVGIYCINTKASEVRGNNIQNTKGAGIYCQAVSDVTVSENVVLGSEGTGITFENGSTGRILDNEFTNTGANAAVINNSTEENAVYASGNKLHTGSGNGFYISGSQVVLSENQIEEYVTSGIRIASDSIVKAENNVITGTQNGINASQSDVTLKKNEIKASNANGIYAKGCTVNISENTIRESGSLSIRIVEDPVTITSGEVKDNILYVQEISVPSGVNEFNNIIYGKITDFDLHYYLDESSVKYETSSITYGTATSIKTIKELDYNKTGYTFDGWKVFREDSGTWRSLEKATGKIVWKNTDIIEAGDEYSYAFLADGVSLSTTVPAGTTLRLYAQWKAKTTFTVAYHLSDGAGETKTSEVVYGVATPIRKISELGFSQAGKDFVGWKVYREDIDSWRVVDSKGVQSWAKTVPAGGKYYLYADGTSVGKTTPVGTTVHMYAQWQNNTTFTVAYHLTDEEAATESSEVVYGVATPIKKISELGFSQNGKEFTGWRIYREDIDSWRVVDSKGVQSWSTTVPTGGKYYLYADGTSVGKTTPVGTTVHMYAQWKNNTTFTVAYHQTDGSAVAETSEVVYGVATPILKIGELKFSQSGKDFAGWKVYREDIDSWRVVDSKGTQSWSKTVPAGGKYYLYADGTSVGKTTPVGTTVHMYGQWKNNTTFTVAYHETDGSAVAETSEVAYGVATTILKVDELKFTQNGKDFAGWKVYREDIDSWRVVDSKGAQSWSQTVPVGGKYYLYADGTSVAKTTPVGTTVHMYAQWKNNTTFTIAYHLTDEAVATETSEVVYGVATPIRRIDELKFNQSGKDFTGWKVFREDIDCWRVVDSKGNQSWSKAVPAGGKYYLYADGTSVGRTTPVGTTVHMYAQWKSNTTFTVAYHLTEGSTVADTSEVVFGVATPIQKISELGFSQTGKVFTGWKVYREDIDSWRVVDSKGVQSWSKTVPIDGNYYLYADGTSVGKTTPVGTTVHMYAIWN